MKPIIHQFVNDVYRGPTPEIGDLFVERIEPGCIRVVYKPEPEELAALAAGGLVELVIWNEPIPPVSLAVQDPGVFEEVAEHPFKAIPELNDEERRSDAGG